MADSSSESTNLLLVRHGESLRNREQAVTGADTGLTELGWRQSQALADWLARYCQADALVSSGLERARQTADIISQRTGLPVEEVAGLEEAEQSYWAELPFQQAGPLAAWDDAWRLREEHAPVYAAFRRRLRRALAQLLAAHAGRTVIVVAHGGTIGTILRSLFGGHQVTIHSDNTGITHIAWEGGCWRLICHNRIEHLAALQPAGEARATSADHNATKGSRVGQMDLIRSFYARVAAAHPNGAELPAERDLRQLIRLAEPQPADRVLDAGTGSGSVAFAFAPHVASVLALDVSPAMLEVAERRRTKGAIQNVHLRLGDIGAASLPAAAFEIIVCHNLLRYVPELTAQFAALRRMLAPGGRLLIDELVGCDDPVKRATHHAIELRRDPALVRICTAGEIEAAAGAAGYRVQVMQSYAERRDLQEWLDRAAADEPTRTAVRRMLEAGIVADSAGLSARSGRDGQISFAHTRVRMLALPRRDRVAG